MKNTTPKQCSFVAMKASQIIKADNKPNGGKKIQGVLLLKSVFFNIRGIVHHEYVSEGQKITKE